MKYIVCLVFAVCIVFPVFSLSLENLVGTSNAALLRSGNTITEAQLRNPGLTLLPQHQELQRYVTAAMAALGPNIAVETLYLYRKPAASAAASPAAWTETQRADLFNQILTLSTLTGIEYYSASRQTMRTFYEFSHVIDSADTKKQVPDPFFLQPPLSLTVYARQKDLTFGDNIYQYDFITTRDAFFFTQENLTALTVGIIPAIGRNRLKSVMAVIDCGDFLLIYAVSMARAASIPGLGDRISSSFGNRAEAILQWFTAKADKVF